MLRVNLMQYHARQGKHDPSKRKLRGGHEHSCIDARIAFTSGTSAARVRHLSVRYTGDDRRRVWSIHY